MARRDYICCAECECKILYDRVSCLQDEIEERTGWKPFDILCPRCLKNLRARVKAQAEELKVLRTDYKIALAERDTARASLDRAVQILTDIHSHAPIPTEGGLMVFRPRSHDPHETLQMLSDRIRAIPEELDRDTGMILSKMRPKPEAPE